MHYHIRQQENLFSALSGLKRGLKAAMD